VLKQTEQYFDSAFRFVSAFFFKSP